MMRWAVVALTALTLPALAHDGVDHKTPGEAAAHAAGGQLAKAPAQTPVTPFPVDIRAEFSLTDHHGRQVTQADFAGKTMAIFFGYASCQAICSVAMPRLGEALDILGDKSERITPLLITVDPERDTVDAMGPALAKWHPRLIGLTGSAEALARARQAFQVERSKVFDDPEGQPVYAHGSFIYLVGPDGKVQTLLPPILGPERMAEVIAGYL